MAALTSLEPIKTTSSGSVLSERRGLLMSNTEHLDSLIKGDRALVWYTFGGQTLMIEIRRLRRTGLGKK